MGPTSSKTLLSTLNCNVFGFVFWMSERQATFPRQSFAWCGGNLYNYSRKCVRNRTVDMSSILYFYDFKSYQTVRHFDLAVPRSCEISIFASIAMFGFGFTFNSMSFYIYVCRSLPEMSLLSKRTLQISQKMGVKHSHQLNVSKDIRQDSNWTLFVLETVGLFWSLCEYIWTYLIQHGANSLTRIASFCGLLVTMSGFKSVLVRPPKRHCYS